MENLTPLQQDRFVNLNDLARDGLNIGPEAKKVLNDLKNKVAHGKPIDTNHEGMSHLTPSQQTAVKGLLRRRKNGEKLP